MERFHDELRQEDRGIKRGGLKDSDEHIRKRKKVMDNKVEMWEEGFRNQDMDSDNESNTFSEEDNSELSEQSDGGESDSELLEQSNGGESDSELSGQSDKEENDSESEEYIKYLI